MIKDGKKVRFKFWKENELWYETETGFLFPVQTYDAGTTTFPAEDKAILYMRWIRKHIEMTQKE